MKDWCRIVVALLIALLLCTILPMTVPAEEGIDFEIEEAENISDDGLALEELNDLSDGTDFELEKNGPVNIDLSLDGNLDEEILDDDPALQPNAYYSQDGIEINEINFPDPFFRKMVSDKLDLNEDGFLFECDDVWVTSLTIGKGESDDNIASLKGIELFSKLEYLRISGTKITTLDVSKNSQLEELDLIYISDLTELDISNNQSVKTLIILGTSLASLDLRNCPSLEYVDCSENKLTSVELCNGSALQRFKCESNKTPGYINIGDQPHLWSVDCSNGYWTSINIGDASSLETMDCDGNNLTSLTIGNAPSLTSLICSYNELSVLDVRGCQKIVEIVDVKYYGTDGEVACYDKEDSDAYYEYRRLWCDSYVKIIGGNPVIPTMKPTATPSPTPTPTPMQKIKLSKCKITVKDQTYTGKKLKPVVTVKYGNKALKKGMDYTVSYKDNKAIGIATVIVKGKGGYTGTVKKTFKIIPKVVKLSGMTAGKGKLTAKWKKGKGITGYQLQYGLKKNFIGAKKVKVTKIGTVKTTLKGLKAGKTYYVRIRTYKKVEKDTYWSVWSGAKQARVK